MSTVLICCDKFKGSATSEEVNEALARGLASAGHRGLTSPLADGGDGTLEVFDQLGYQRVAVTVRGSDGRPVVTDYCLHPGDQTAVIEVARICGLDMVSANGDTPPVDDAAQAGSWGVGDALVDAMARGVRQAILTLGGSATTDAGMGMAVALGMVFHDEAGGPVGRVGEMSRIVSADTSGLDPRLSDLQVVLASDVRNPLCGPEGAAAVFGPQKGLPQDAVPEVDVAVGSFAEAVATATGRSDTATLPGAGAAGGLGFMGLTLFGAELRTGADLVLEKTGFAELLQGADLVITGEGRLDTQTLSGKAPAGVAERARVAGVPVVAVCGQNLLNETEGAHLFEEVHSLTDIEPDVASCIRNPAPLLEEIGARIAVRIECTSHRP